MKIFECSAQGDVVYIQARNLKLAEARLFEVTGSIPANLLAWKEVKALPKGEGFL